MIRSWRELKWIEQQVNEARQKLRELNDEHRKTEKKLRGLEFVARSCRQADLNTERCFFPNGVDLDRLIREHFADGKHDRLEMYQEIRKQSQFEKTWTEKASEKIDQTLGSETSQAALLTVGGLAGEAVRAWLRSKGAR